MRTAEKEQKKASDNLASSVETLQKEGNYEALTETIDFKEAAFEKVESPEPVIEEVKQPEMKKINSRPQTPADYDKKERQRPKFTQVNSKIEGKKTEAAARFKQGDYIGANKIYQ